MSLQNTIVTPVAYSANGLISIVFGPSLVNDQTSKIFESTNDGTKSLIVHGTISLVAYCVFCAMTDFSKSTSDADKKSTDWNGYKGSVVTVFKTLEPITRFFADRPGLCLIGSLGIYVWRKFKIL